MAVNHNIGGIKNIFNNANKVPDLINTDPIPNPYDKFIDYNSLRSSTFDSRRANGVFIWNLHTWGSSTHEVGE